MKFKNLINAALVAAVGLIWAPSAIPASTSSTIAWTMPTTYTDGSAIVPSDIKESIVTWYRPGSTVAVGSVHVAAPATSVSVTGLSCGSFEFSVVAVVKTVNSDESSRALFATGIQCKPNPPTGVTAS